MRPICAIIALSIALPLVAQPPEKKLLVTPADTWPGIGPIPAAQLQFSEKEGTLTVKLTIEGPASRQIVLTDARIDDGTPAWDEPPIGVAKPRRGPPQVYLRYLVLVNHDLPGFQDKGLMTLPTPPEIRKAGRQDVVWNFPNYRHWGFKKDDAKFHVSGVQFEAGSEQLKAAMATMQKTISEAARNRTNAPAP
jgi:hypothetical protein